VQLPFDKDRDMPVPLTDQQIDQILLAARPLARRDRDAFLRAVVDALPNGGTPGDGDLFRILRETQRRFWDPPQLGDPGRVTKYG
jgi:hypothetical protein